MIYVITPYLSDVVSRCAREGLVCPVKCGHLLNKNITWIYQWEQLAGIKINPHDKIWWGDKSNDFPPELYKRIYEEIEIRKRY